MSDLSWLTARPIAHRGLHDSNRLVWENTLSAFSLAIEKGYAIECDVHLSADGEVVVLHDNDFRRLTGEDGYVWQVTGAEIAAMRVGGTEDHPPTLRETLDLVAGQVPIVVELKGTPGHDTGLVQAVAEILRSYSGRIAIMSFDHWLIRDFKRHMPDIPAGLTAWGIDAAQVEAHFGMLAHGISFTSYAVDHLPNPFITFVRERLAMPVISWTVRDETAVKRTFEYADQMTFEGFDPDSVAVA